MTPEGYVFPDGYRHDVAQGRIYSLDSDGATRDVLLHAVLVVGGRLVDADGQVALRVAWRDHAGQVVERVVAMDAALDARRLQRLAADGLPVTSANATRVAAYVADVLAANRDTLPTERMTHRLGWIGEDFVAGPDHPGIIVQAGPGQRRAVEAFRPLGHLDGWRDATALLADHPRAQLGIFASLAPGLLDTVDAPNFTLDWSGETSRGKTTTLQVAASVWGHPQRVVSSWSATQVAVERRAALLSGLPLILDDTKEMIRPEMASAVLYQIAQGEGRSRGSVDGLQETATWRTILLSSGEQPITSFDRQGGAGARAVLVEGSPFAVEDADTVDALRRALGEHHGHAGRAFVTHVQAVDKAALVARFRTLHGQVSGWASTTVARRRAEAVALLVLAAELALAAGLVDRIPDDLFWGGLVGSEESDDRPRAALDEAYAWAGARETSFYGRADFNTPPGGRWLGSWRDGHLAFTPEALREALARSGFDYESVIRAWRDRGWTDTSPGRLSAKVRCGDSALWMVKLGAAALAEVDGEANCSQSVPAVFPPVFPQ